MIVNSINAYTPSRKISTKPSFAPLRQADTLQLQNFGGSKKESAFSKAFNKLCAKVADIKIVKDTLTKIASAKAVTKVVEWAEKDKNARKLDQGLMIGYSGLLQTGYVINIMKNKEIPEERKEVLAVNNALLFVVPTLGAVYLDNNINEGINKFQKYAEKIKKKKFNKIQTDGLKTLKSICVFALMYKYFSTLITTPIAGPVTDFLKNQGIIGKKKEKANSAQSPSK